MIYFHSLGRAFRYYAQRSALVVDGTPLSFRALHERVRNMAAALAANGFIVGYRLAFLLPNSPEYIEMVYACSWLGVTAVPINARLSAAEIDQVLLDAKPRGLVRHSSLPKPAVQLPWQLVLDEQPLDLRHDSCPDPVYTPEAILALIYTSGTTGRPKGVMVTHANVQANVDHLSYWMRYREGGVFLHAAPIFHIADFPALFAAPAFGARQVTLPKFSPQDFCEVVQRERVTHTVLVPTMLNLLTQMPEAKPYDLGSLEVLAYGGSPMAPELVRRTRKLLPNAKLLHCYGLSETGFLTGLEDRDHVEAKLLSCGRSCPGIDLRVQDETGKEVEVGQHGFLDARGPNVMQGYWNNPQESALAFRNGMFPIYTLPAVHEVAVFGIPDPKWGELVMAYVVLKPGMTLAANELVDHCRHSLATLQNPAAGGVPDHGATQERLRQDIKERFARALLDGSKACGRLKKTLITRPTGSTGS
jgi:long-chain acyl-CoA synthetase